MQLSVSDDACRSFHVVNGDNPCDTFNGTLGFHSAGSGLCGKNTAATPITVTKKKLPIRSALANFMIRFS
jgi:hypothetical protein